MAGLGRDNKEKGVSGMQYAAGKERRAGKALTPYP